MTSQQNSDSSILSIDDPISTTPAYHSLPSSNLPILYALLEDKHHTSYAAVLEFLQRRCPLFNPVTTIVDFETAEHKAIFSVFPHTTLRGCLFHFCQCQLKQFRGVPVPFITTDEVLRSLLYTCLRTPVSSSQRRCQRLDGAQDEALVPLPNS